MTAPARSASLLDQLRGQWALVDVEPILRPLGELILSFIEEDGSIIDAPVDWIGYLDTMPIEANGETCTITVTAESSAVDLLRGNAMTTSNADQQALYPGDRALEYIVSQSGVPVVWPTKQYYIDSR